MTLSYMPSDMMNPWDDALIDDLISSEDAMLDIAGTLEDFGLEDLNQSQPDHAFQDMVTIVEWWSDGDDSRYERY